MKLRRRNKLPLASLQVRMALPFLIATFGALLCHVLVLARGVTAASEAAGADATFAQAVTGAYYGATVWTLAIVGPCLLVFSVLMTFRYAGPIYRMRSHLQAIADGAEPSACRLRQGDELQDLCEAMNRAIERLQAADGRQEPVDVVASPEAVPSPLASPDAEAPLGR